jgi:hypothetical protein
MTMTACGTVLPFHGVMAATLAAGSACSRTFKPPRGGVRLAATPSRTTVKKRLFTSVSVGARIGALTGVADVNEGKSQGFGS